MEVETALGSRANSGTMVATDALDYCEDVKLAFQICNLPISRLVGNSHDQNYIH